LLDHGDELREWLGKDVFNTMDSEQRKKLKQEVPDGTFVDDGRLQISEVDMRLTARAGGRLGFRKDPSRSLRAPPALLHAYPRANRCPLALTLL
jgi:hypothetical protein